METFSALLAVCAGNSPVPSEFPAQRPVPWSFAVFFDLRLNKRLSKHREAGDLRCYHAHYDVIVMLYQNQASMSTSFSQCIHSIIFIQGYCQCGHKSAIN